MAVVDPQTHEVNGTVPPETLTSRKSSPEAEYREGEMELVEWCTGLFSDAERAKDEQCQPDGWEDWTQEYWGDTWPSKTPLFKPKIVINEIKRLALQELSDLTDSRITVFVQKDPAQQGRDEAAERSIQG